ncbi:putative hydrolase of the HAD superfamily [Breznakibacter xylanolyticus]|uniref:Putative hydrolase of the HAD superfamily n=2 Tax=Breznakibacter xylanolyticus TaxID=990 RepID=A0A2W7PBR8_9BACT|nr:putative hydrolase of the HAD superfamily [Breznakibacter xylanolyticus]
MFAMSRRYKHLFFDLDHTLWDFDTNASLTLRELFVRYQLERFFDSYEQFFEAYQPVNADLWAQYHQGLIKKSFLYVERFAAPFRMFGCEDRAMAERFGSDFLAECALKTALMPHAIDVLDYLKPFYQMHIITNGFKEVQYQKMEKSGLAPYFTKVFISEVVGAQKPSKVFFQYAVKSANARKVESLVIGDNLDADIQGAKNFNLDHVFYNPHCHSHAHEVMNEISSLLDLKLLL